MILLKAFILVGGISFAFGVVTALTGQPIAGAVVAGAILLSAKKLRLL